MSSLYFLSRTESSTPPRWPHERIFSTRLHSHSSWSLNFFTFFKRKSLDTNRTQKFVKREAWCWSDAIFRFQPPFSINSWEWAYRWSFSAWNILGSTMWFYEWINELLVGHHIKVNDRHKRTSQSVKSSKIYGLDQDTAWLSVWT